MWVLYLDADERLDPSSREVIKNLTAEKSKLGVRCKIYNIDEVNNKPKVQSSTRLFFNTSGIEFRGKAHEQIDNSLVENGYSIINSELLINHIGYNIDKKGLRKKASRNLKLLLEDYSTNSSGYCAFQIANSYSILNNKEKSYQYYTLSLSDLTLPIEYQSLSLSNIAEYYLRLNDIEKALLTAKDAVECDPASVISNLTASEIFYKAGKGTEAVEYCKKALAENENVESRSSTRLLDVFLDGAMIIYHGLNVAYSTNQRDGIDFFFEKLECLKSENQLQWRKELNLIQTLSMNSPLSSEEINHSIELINENSLDFYLALFKNYDHNEVLSNLLAELVVKFPENIVIRNKYALNLSKSGQAQKAISVFEDSHKLFPEDVSPIFYLISLYLEHQELSKLESIIESSKEKYSENKAFINHINEFETKVNSYLLNTN